MNLGDIYEQEGVAGLKKLADASGFNPAYLYQCATRRKVPAPKATARLIAADGRLTFGAMYGHLVEEVTRDAA